MNALLARTGVAKDAAEAFHRAYPDAPRKMIEAAVFHGISEGIEATVDWLAAIERFLRDPSPTEIDYGALWHIVYHLYNLQQFQALLPVGRVGLTERIRDVQHFLSEGDSDSAKTVLKDLLKSLDGNVTPPSVGD